MVSESRFIYTWRPVHIWRSLFKIAMDIHFWRSKLLDLAEGAQTHIASLYQIFRQFSLEDRSHFDGSLEAHPLHHHSS